MSFKEYLKDKAAAIGITLAGLALSVIFMIAFHDTIEQIVIVGSMIILTGVTMLLWGFFRKHRFYDRLTEDIEKLDKKYLISEMVDEPEFMEGKIIHELLVDAGKSMCENVAAHRRTASQFREYIEMWVHEVKLPVASLQLMSHNDPDGKKYSLQLHRIEDYIDNVLYYARSENAEKDYIIKNVVLKRAFTETAIKHREALQQLGVSLRTEGLDKEVMTDSKWLGYILGQLMSNSMKYIDTSREPEIFVFAEEDAKGTRLHFRDNGIGIPEKDLPHIFEKSHTGENGRYHAGSTGMGLYIVKSLCRRLGHDITAESVRGEYTDIIITFGKGSHTADALD